MKTNVTSLSVARTRKKASAELKLKVGIGGQNLGKVKNEEWTWSKVVEIMHTPLMIPTSITTYAALGAKNVPEAQKKANTDRKLKLKSSSGFIFSGWCAGGIRKKANVEFHSFVMLDLDNLSHELFWDVESNDTPLKGIRHAWHTTIGHMPNAPRVRIAVPTSRHLDKDEFLAVSKLLARSLDPAMEQVDKVSSRLTQIMFMPVVCKGGEFKAGQDDGEILDVDKFLADCGFDWRDVSLLPLYPGQSASEVAREASGKKAQDPTVKTGVVGEFCRRWDIPAAMDEFLPGVYVASDSGDDRYTYSDGHSSNGAVVYDDGKFLYSNHGSDPCSDQNVNSFDMVRIHLFGDKDADNDDDNAKSKYERMSDRPSYKALLTKLEEEYPDFKQALGIANYLNDDDIDDVFGVTRSDDEDDDEEVASETGEQKELFDELGNAIHPKPLKGVLPVGRDDWRTMVEYDSNNMIKVTHANISKILTFHPRYAPALEYNIFTGRVHSRVRPKTVQQLQPGTWDVRDSLNGIRWSAHMRTTLSVDLSQPRTKDKNSGLGLKVPQDMLRDCVEDAARQKPFHPVREYLQSQQWDCVPRAETFFIRHLGVEDTPYTRAVTRMFFMAAVARVMEPGIKFDYMLVLEGMQGIGKSFFIEAMAYLWGGDLVLDFDDERKAVNSTTGKWIMEFGEMKGLRGDRVEEMKQWLSQRIDRVRLAYREDEEDFPRQWVVVATTNETTYLHDTTGSRRFLPLLCTFAEIDLVAVRAEMAQVWAENYCRYQVERIDNPSGALPLWLQDAEVKAAAKEKQEARNVMRADPWRGVIEGWLDGEKVAGMTEDGAFDVGGELVPRNVTCPTEVLIEALGRKPGQISSAEGRRVKSIILDLGSWKAAPRKKRFGPEIGFHPVLIRIGSEEDF